jgi:hypothetical protein
MGNIIPFKRKAEACPAESKPEGWPYRTWGYHTVTARLIAYAINDRLDFEERLDARTLQIVAECMASLFEFEDCERDIFLTLSLAHHDDEEDE